MAHIDLAKPYEEYLRSQVRRGLFSSITAAAENAIAKQMETTESNRISHLKTLIEKGESDVKTGKIFDYHSNSISEFAKEGIAAAQEDKPVKHEVR